MTSLRLCVFIAAGLLAFAFPHSASAIRVKGEPARASTKKETPLAWRSNNFPVSGIARLGLKDLVPERIAKLHNDNADDSTIKPMQIGIGRDVASEVLQPMTALKWQVLSDGSKVSRIEVHSPDAFGLRVGIRTAGLSPGSELRFSGSDSPNQVIALATADETKRLVNDKNIYWTPGTDGETQIIEIYIPKGSLAAPVRISIVSISHLLTNAKENFSIEKGAAEQTCMSNVICRTAELGQNFVDAKNSVARITFVDSGSGTSFLCTGSLLTDTVGATQIPYFYTADHCVSNQAEAGTMNFYWNYETTSCGTSRTTALLPTPQTSGATYLYSEVGARGAGTDISLVRLNSAPPAGSFFAGWDSAALSNNTTVYAIHHPEGFPKKISQGIKETQSAKLHQVGWSSGSTLQGSSGSGLFTVGSDGSWYLRGGLFRGSASCANSGNPANLQNDDEYSRLDVSFPRIQQYLAPTAANGPTVSHSGSWWNPAEGGWGLTWFEYPSNGHFGLMFIYDTMGRADWYELSGNWTGSDIHSGIVKRVSGPAFSTTYNPALVGKADVGTYSISFSSAGAGSFSYTINGITRTNNPLVKTCCLSTATTTRSGSWWNPAEGGWGLTWFDYPGNGHFGLMFTYDTAGRADWYELSGSWTSPSIHSGNVFRVSGPPFSTSFDSSVVSKAVVGVYSMDFSSSAAGNFTYTINGVTRTNNPEVKTCCITQ
jgi:lysyl endopeptidase